MPLMRIEDDTRLEDEFRDMKVNCSTKIFINDRMLASVSYTVKSVSYTVKLLYSLRMLTFSR